MPPLIYPLPIQVIIYLLIFPLCKTFENKLIMNEISFSHVVVYPILFKNPCATHFGSFITWLEYAHETRPLFHIKLNLATNPMGVDKRGSQQTREMTNQRTKEWTNLIVDEPWRQ